jgi:K(+)-stimulated pyrophosphate-energized sodium pump
MMIAAPVFAFGLVAFGFLGMGPVTIAVDSYGPVTDNAQSVYELSLIEQHSEHRAGAEKGLQLRCANFEPRQGPARRKRRRGQHIQSHREARAHRHRRGGRHHDDFLDHHGSDERLTTNVDKLSLLHAPFVLGLITGGAMIFWFTALPRRR